MPTCHFCDFEILHRVLGGTRLGLVEPGEPGESVEVCCICAIDRVEETKYLDIPVLKGAMERGMEQQSAKQWWVDELQSIRNGAEIERQMRAATE